MPSLTNQRQERFCQLLKQGIPPFRAYPQAGYRQHNGAPYRLCENVIIKRRMAELTRHIAVKTRVTVESLSDEFDEAAALALETKNPAALTNARIAKGKLHGLMVDRKETGAPGDFAAANSADEVLDIVRKELGEAAANAIMAALGKSEDQPALEPTHDADSTLN